MDAVRWNTPANYHDSVRISNILDLYVHVLKYGCQITDFEQTGDHSYIVGVSGQAEGPSARWFVLSVAEEE